MEPTKTRIRQGLHTLLKTKEKTEIQAQEQSPLFHLPPEIREKIWHFTLLPGKKSAQPHFHIYDDVYDSCLYWSEYKGYKRRPRVPVQMSLLLTCRAIYHEAKLLLYNNTRFTLVILAGNPRGHTNHRHCLGPIKEGAQLFSRMKDVTLIVQPGSKRPDAEKYAARIARLLDAMDYLRHAEKLHLYLNFHAEFFQFSGAKQRFSTILTSFHSLNRRGRNFTAHFQQFLYTDPSITDLQAQLLYKIAGPNTPSSTLQTSSASRTSQKCERRGVVGWQPGPAPATRKWEYPLLFSVLAVGVGSYLVALPVSVPLTYAMLVKRKVNKGEDDVWKPWKIF